MADTLNRNERRKTKTIGAILDAAAALFQEKGVQRTTIEEIAAQADVSIGSVYFHFKSKEALYLALVEQALDVNAEYMQQADDPDLTPFERVLAAGDAYLRFHLERPGAFRMIALRVLEPSPGVELSAVEGRIADRVEQMVGAVEADLRAAISAGEVRDADAKPLMSFLWGAWNGVIALSLRQDRLRLDGDELTDALDAGRRMMIEGLATPRAKRRLHAANARAG